MFGTPIAGYRAPTEITAPPAARSLAYLIQVLASAWADDQLITGSLPAMTPEVETMLRG